MAVDVVTVVDTLGVPAVWTDTLLRSVAGRPLLWWQLERMRRARHAGEIVLSVPDHVEATSLLEICAPLGVPVVAGSAHDLIRRQLEAASRFAADVVVGVRSNCPLIDPWVMDLVIASFLMNPNSVDYVSNVHPPSWPTGLGVEVIPVDVLEEASLERRRPLERAHPAPFIWERSDRYRCHNVTWDRDLSTVCRLTVDQPGDVDLIESILTRLPVTASIEEIVDLLSESPMPAGDPSRRDAGLPVLATAHTTTP